MDFDAHLSRLREAAENAGGEAEQLGRRLEELLQAVLTEDTIWLDDGRFRDRSNELERRRQEATRPIFRPAAIQRLEGIEELQKEMPRLRKLQANLERFHKQILEILYGEKAP